VVRFTRAALAPAAVAGLGAAAGRAVRADLREARGRARALARDNDVVLVEGVGGALAPLGGRWTVADLIREIGAPVWVVARAGLGTLNHSLLTLEALRRRGLPVRRLIVNGYRGKTRAERTNVPLLRGLARLPVTVVPYVTGHSTAAAARSVLGAAFSEDFGRTA
jgi:dethiobiotin synthetase